MDHYALPDDSLHKAWRSGTLHRNFMGYTTQHTSLLIGLGVSSISDACFAFAQNHKTLSEYYEAVEAGELAVFKGYALSQEDELFRKYILDVCCQGRVEFDPISTAVLEEYCFPELAKLEADGLVNWNAQGLQVNATGRNFIRNIARCFDLHLLRNTVADKGLKFSKAV
jgi:oxygen-independent coproporphyrinogen III oxidase